MSLAQKRTKKDTDEASKNKPNAVAKVPIVKKSKEDIENEEISLLNSIQTLLRLHNIERSHASIRDIADVTKGSFGYRDAVSALQNMDFMANVGNIPIRKLVDGHCPLIIEFKDKKNAVLTKVVSKKEYIIYDDESDEKYVSYNYAQFKKLFTGSVLLAKSRKQQREGKKDKRIDWFWSSLSQSKWTYSQVILAAAVSNFLGLSSSLFIMVVYDRVVPNQAIESLIALTIGVVIALGFDFLIKTLKANFIDRAGKRADTRMSRLIFNQLMSMNLATKNEKSGALASTVREFESLRDFFTSATLVAIVDLPFIFLFIYIISLIGGPLALVPLICVPIVLITGIVVQPFLAKLSLEGMQTGMSKQGVLVETLNGLETIKATGSAGLMRKRFEEASVRQSDLGFRTRAITQFAINSSASVQQFAQIAIIFYGVFLIADGIVTMGALIASVILTGRTLAPLSQLASALTRVNSARTAYSTINALMKKPRDREEGENPLSRPNLKGEIEFKNVTFTYPGANDPTLKDLSFKINPGEKVAILGKMGSGKSTIARLLAGLYEPDVGSILIDGVDLRQIDQSDIRRNIGFMLQDTWLFSGSVKENIQMGFVQYSDEHILNVSKISGVDDFVSQNPSGYDFQLKERGEGLSGGQKQSINLARSILHNPSVLILDEPTSSMDSATEKAVLDNLNSWLEGKSLIAITHRNSLVRLVSRVLVIDKGILVADDVPEKLMGPRPA
ncbi:MAG: type I secretion system permease/ATPase [Paracoccaceae bacterium]